MSAPRPARAGLLAFRRGPVEGQLKVLVMLLVGFGLVMVYSASNVLSMAQYGKSTVFLTGQLTKALAGFVLMFVVGAIDYRIWQRLAKPILWLSILFLLVLVVPVAGRFTPEINGARRWIVLPGFQFQPLALARLALVVWMAATMVRKGGRLERLSDGVGPLVFVPIVMAALLLLQPDFKGATMLLAAAGMMLYLGGVRFRHLVALGAAATAVLAAVLVIEPYRLRRIAAFFDPDHDVQGLSYQIHQSLISLGSGGWLGIGLGGSKQKFAFLPAAYNDFIFSIIGEELGILGTLFVLGAFLYLGWLGFRIARRAPDPFGFLLASGLTTVILMGALVNMAVVTANLPTTGLTLPFISYGGTELVIQLVMVGILLSVSRDAVEPTGSRRSSRSRRGRWWRRLLRKAHRGEGR